MSTEYPRPSRASRIQRRIARAAKEDSIEPPVVLDELTEGLVTIAESLEDRRSATPSEIVESWLDLFLEELHELLRGPLGFDRMALALLTDASRVVTARWARANYSPISIGRGYQEALADTTLERLLFTGRSRVIPDLEQHLKDRPSSVSTSWLIKEGVRSSLTCPLSRPGRSDGFLFFSSRRPGHFRVEHGHLLDALRSQICELVVRMDAYDHTDAARKLARSWAYAALPRDFADRALRGERQGGRSDPAAIVVGARLHDTESFHARFSISELAEKLDVWQRIFQLCMSEAGLEPVLCDGRDTLAILCSATDCSASPEGVVEAARSVARELKRALSGFKISMALSQGLLVCTPVGCLRKGLALLGPAVEQTRFLLAKAEPGQLLVDNSLLHELEASGARTETHWVQGRRASDIGSGFVPRYGALPLD